MGRRVAEQGGHVSGRSGNIDYTAHTLREEVMRTGGEIAPLLWIFKGLRCQDRNAKLHAALSLHNLITFLTESCRSLALVAGC
jgi:hypothetical protein